jgi:prepilin-type N-terminal cleavage/methylation domain-containing protein
MLIRRLRKKGHSLIEMACCLAIIAIISGGIGQTLLSGVKMNLISGSEAAQQRVAVNFTRLLREDLRAATDVQVSADGRTITITKGALPVSYQYIAPTQQIRRSVSGVIQSFPDDSDVNSRGLKLSCDGDCFKMDKIGGNPSQSFLNKNLNLSKITITDNKTKLSPNDNGAKWKSYTFGPNKYQVASGSLFN